ncbi:MAG: hypothetical protein M9894_08670 [Planctomycetes bacterium]|nr:hypothetical protein [Planctomycetota bacterium]
MSSDESVRHTASQRLKAIAAQAVTKERVRSVLATRLVALGLALVCFAGGLDYFTHGEDVHKAVVGIARDSGQGQLVDDLERAGAQVGAWKAAALALVPDTLQEYVVLCTAALGFVLLGWGLRAKLGTGSQAERGRAMWDLGRIIIGPGIVGVLAYLVVTLRTFPVVRRTTAAFVDKVRAGALGWGDVGALTVKYHAWVWHEIGPVLVLGVLGVVGALVVRAGRGRPAVDVLRRACLAAGALALLYYAGVTAVAVSSYGAALPATTWPWKVRPATFALTLSVMSLGVGLAWTGLGLMRRAPQEADVTPAAAGRG